MITIGNEGLCKAKLVIPQGCSVSFSVIHKDDQAQVIDKTPIPALAHRTIMHIVGS